MDKLVNKETFYINKVKNVGSVITAISFAFLHILKYSKSQIEDIRRYL